MSKGILCVIKGSKTMEESDLTMLLFLIAFQCLLFAGAGRGCDAAPEPAPLHNRPPSSSAFTPSLTIHAFYL